MHELSVVPLVLQPERCSFSGDAVPTTHVFRESQTVTRGVDSRALAMGSMGGDPIAWNALRTLATLNTNTKQCDGSVRTTLRECAYIHSG